MEWVNVAYTADGVLGIIGFIGWLFIFGLTFMWLSSFYILSTWWDSHRINSPTTSSTTTSSHHATRQQLKKINSFMSPVSTTDILLN